MKNDTISVNGEMIEEMIFASNELSEALWKTAYSGKAKFILGKDPENEGKQAIDFIKEYADLTGAVLRMIAATTDIITTGIVNDEIEIRVKQDSPE